MLVLRRKQGQTILIGEDIKITVWSIERGRVKIGIEAPDGVKIIREELVQEVQHVQKAN